MHSRAGGRQRLPETPQRMPPLHRESMRLWVMWMTCPDQADRPQGSHRVSDGILAANDPGTGSGWQQSKQNWARPALELQRCDEVISNVFIRSQLAAW